MPATLLEVVPLGGPPWVTADPFLFCVHHVDAYPAANADLGPAASLAGRSIGQDFANKDGWNMYHGDVVPGFPQHPHRGFETVTVVRRGLVDHSDSLGAKARYGRGDTQWLTAGGGISHAEMFPLLDRGGPNPAELFQIWLNLPAADKLAPPHFTMLWADEIPTVDFTDAKGRASSVTVVAGELEGRRPPPPPPRSWAARPDTDVAIWTLRLSAGATLTLPPARAASALRTLYAFAGDSVKVGGDVVRVRSAAAVDPTAPLVLEAGAADVEILMLQGRPIGEPVAQHGPFVMNTRAELQRAFQDYQRTRFGGWPWDRADPTHGLEPGRFAQHVDGRVERRP
jgi:redox-sensitive bicupin YhaK (pirin superfamily)